MTIPCRCWMTTRPRETRTGSDVLVEIERKYLLRAMPVFPKDAKIELWWIEQGYLDATIADAHARREAIAEGRLRRIVMPDGSVKHVHTLKRGLGLVRQEIEREISPAEFQRHWLRTAGARLRKTRHRVRAGDMIWEIDVFEGIELVLAEIELPTADTSVSIPVWLTDHVVREVTNDPAYTNSSIARRIKLA